MDRKDRKNKNAMIPTNPKIPNLKLQNSKTQKIDCNEIKYY
jgi:hypothetical protein